MQTEESLQQQSQLMQDKIVEINDFMAHLRRMEGIQQMATALKQGMEQRNKASEDMEAQIKECKEYLINNI